ncbi:MAG TPA: M20 family metallopeptidase [Saprospiraceae bacterium]|nr:M20 family metallopeptidase [Saprospiraceae bacterium]HMQ82619.1 M20 family metallopeptidase [Saprospiraceae bacterium]
MLLEKIKDLAAAFSSEVIAHRRHLHQYPELSFQEIATRKYVADTLSAYGIPHEHGIAQTGVVALIQGRNPDSKTIALRADMDALPIQEANRTAYRSKHDGVMHACGHDVHTASLLGTAKILYDIRHELEGSIKLIFQPGEEKLPGGASIMIREGVLEAPKPAVILGQHVHPPLEVGKIGLCPGPYMASSDELYMTVSGKGGHGALPQDCVDPILITAHILTALQQIVSRNANPTLPTVLTFGKIESEGGATNVIPNRVHLMGTFRTMDEEWRYEAHRRMLKMATGIAESMEGQCELRIEVGYPVLYNDPALTEQARQDAAAYLGAENVVELPIRMTAEDFAYYSQQLPACFYRLGTGNPEKGIIAPIHTDTFDVDENCLRLSTGLMAWLAVNELKRETV